MVMCVLVEFEVFVCVFDVLGCEMIVLNVW